MGLSPLMGLSVLFVFLGPPWDWGGFLAVLRFDAGLVAGAVLEAAAVKRGERRFSIFSCSLTFRECVGRSQTMA